MEMETRRVLLLGAYGQLRDNLVQAGLLDERGVPFKKKILKKKNPHPVDLEMVELYRLMDKLAFAGDGGSVVALRIRRFNEALSSLPEEETEANLTSFVLHLAILACDGWPGPASLLILRKSQRLLDAILDPVKENREDLPRLSYRLADNIGRILEGKPTLSAEIRNARFQSIRNRMKSA